MSGTDTNMRVEETLRDFWSTRPRRPKSGRKVAGVAAGFGRRYGIDPVVFRVAFVVTTFYGGAGLVLYLLGWLLLPDGADRVSPAEALINKGRSSMSTGMTLALIIALMVSFGYVFNPPWTSSWGSLFGLVLPVAGLFLLHRYRGGVPNHDAPGVFPPPSYPSADLYSTPGVFPTPGASPQSSYPAAAPTASATADAPAAGPSPAPSSEASVSAPTLHPGAEPGAHFPPAWDPLGAAPFAWDLPEPSRPPLMEPEPEPRRRSRITAVTLATAFLLGGTCAALRLVLDIGWFSIPNILGVVLAVLGCGILVGAFARGGRGLVVLAIPVAALTYLTTSFDFNDFRDIRNHEWRPTTVAELQQLDAPKFGGVDLDLRQLDLSKETGPVTSRVDISAGTISVVLPKDLDVKVTCSARVGDVDCLGQREDGVGPKKTVTDNGEDGANPGKASIVLDLNTSAGSVEVVRRG